jgi:2-methylisocitrate lyase-like PEP mutase family enzyme
MSSPNALAKAFRGLHLPRQLIILANVYDAVTARPVGDLSEAKTLATASAAIGAAAGVTDDEVTFDINLAAV